LKSVIIRQPAGAGDIFFSQKIAYHYINLGYKIIWPVIKEYSYFDQYLNDIEYPCRDNDFELKNIFMSDSKTLQKYDDNIFIPIESATGNKIMKSKYDMVHLDCSDWKNFFNFNRNYEKEDELFKLMNLTENEEYNFILNMYASPPNSLIDNRVICDNLNIKTIYMKPIEGYTLFDWCKIIENASYMYLNDSSINYLIEKINLRIKQKIKLWTRRGSDFSEIDYIFNMNLYDKMT